MKEHSKVSPVIFLVLKWSWCGPFLSLLGVKSGAPYYEARPHLRRRVKIGVLVAASRKLLLLIWGADVRKRIDQWRRRRRTYFEDLFAGRVGDEVLVEDQGRGGQGLVLSEDAGRFGDDEIVGWDDGCCCFGGGTRFQDRNDGDGRLWFLVLDDDLGGLLALGDDDSRFGLLYDDSLILLDLLVVNQHNHRLDLLFLRLLLHDNNDLVFLRLLLLDDDNVRLLLLIGCHLLDLLLSHCLWIGGRGSLHNGHGFPRMIGKSVLTYRSRGGGSVRHGGAGRRSGFGRGYVAD